MSELTQHDISQILRGLRRAKRNRDNEIVITTGELLRDEEVKTGLDTNRTNLLKFIGSKLC